MNRAIIHFFIGDREYAQRTWFFVPRVGDVVMLGYGVDKKAYWVVQVVWGTDDEGWHARNFAETATPQRFNIFIREKQ